MQDPDSACCGSASPSSTNYLLMIPKSKCSFLVDAAVQESPVGCSSIWHLKDCYYYPHWPALPSWLASFESPGLFWRRTFKDSLPDVPPHHLTILPATLISPLHPLLPVHVIPVVHIPLALWTLWSKLLACSSRLMLFKSSVSRRASVRHSFVPQDTHHPLLSPVSCMPAAALALSYCR